MEERDVKEMCSAEARPVATVAPGTPRGLPLRPGRL